MVVDIKYFWEASKTIFNSDLLFYDYACSFCEHIHFWEIKIIFIIKIHLSVLKLN